MSNASSRASSRQRRTSFILSDSDNLTDAADDKQAPSLARKSSSDRLPSLARVAAAYGRDTSAASGANNSNNTSAPTTPSDSSLLSSNNNSSSANFFDQQQQLHFAASADDALKGGSIFKVVPNAANVLAVRKLMEERCETHRLRKKVKVARRQNRERIEAMERSMMEQEDSLAHMCMRNLLWVDDMGNAPSPNRAVRGIAPNNNRRSGNNATTGSATPKSASEESAAVAAAGAGGATDHSYHFRYSRRASSNNGKRAFAASNSGSVTFAGIRRFGFATAALPNLAEAENIEHARLIIALRDQPLQPQSLAPEAHALLVRNSNNCNGSIGQLLRDFHENTVDALNEQKRFSDTAIDSLAFIFEEAAQMQSQGRGILRDPRDDFYRELHLVAEQTQAMLKAHMLRSNETVLHALRAAAALGSNNRRDNLNGNNGDALASTPMRPPPAMPMAAASVGFSNHNLGGGADRRSIGVQVGSSREEQLQRELDEVRAQCRRLQVDSVQAQKAKGEELAAMTREAERLKSRTELLHQCLLFQKEGTAAAIGKVSQLEKQMEAVEATSREQQLLQVQQRQQQQQPVDNGGSYSTSTSNNVSAAPSKDSSPDLKERTGSYHDAVNDFVASSIVPKTPPPPPSISEHKQQSNSGKIQIQTQQQQQPAAPAARTSLSFREKTLVASSSTSITSMSSSLDCTTPRDETFIGDDVGAAGLDATKNSGGKKQQQHVPVQHASTPQVESFHSDFRFPYEEHGVTHQQQLQLQQLPVKPRSASRRLTMPAASSSGAIAPQGVATSARGATSGKENTATCGKNGNNSSSNNQSLGASRKNSTSSLGFADSFQQQQQQPMAPAVATVCVSESLKRMENWQAAQSQLWERRRSQLERRTAFDGMLQLTKNSSGSSGVNYAAAVAPSTSGRAQQQQQVAALPLTSFSAPSVPSGNQPFHGVASVTAIAGAKRK